MYNFRDVKGVMGELTEKEMWIEFASCEGASNLALCFASMFLVSKKPGL